MSKTVKLPFWATVFTLLGIIILCSLGAWQLQRLQWKENLLAQLDALYAASPAATLLTAPDLDRASAKGQDFLRGTVQGHYLPGKSFRTGPRILDEQQGTHLFTPFQMRTGGIILVNRGWVPNDDGQDIQTPGHSLTLAGLLRKPGKANIFTPPDNPQADIFYHIDPDKIAVAKGLDQVAPYLLYLEADPDTASPSLPRPIAARPVLNNNHQSYAIFWFTMAGVLCVIYALRFLRPAPKRP